MAVLLQNGPDSRITRIRLDRELLLEVGQSQDRRINQTLLEHLKALFRVIGPYKRGTFLQQIE